jgi:4a-hydroxytetrahydrobiopterin dehydratase
MPAQTLAQLLAGRSRPMNRADGLGADAVRDQLAALPKWLLEEDSGGCAIVRTYRFKNYYETIAFVNAIAYVAHREDHHPDLVVGYNRCTVKFSTHSAGGVSPNDFICAAKCDAVYDGGPVQTSP